MAHEIDFTTGKPAMAWAGEAPWHGLGHELTEGADLDTWVREAQMDWELKSSPVLYGVGSEDSQADVLEYPERVVLHRSDTLSPISIVSSRYKVVQPRDVTEFFRELTELGGFKMETMGVLRGGRYYWALARTSDKKVSVNTTDVVEPYVLLATSSDGTMSTVGHLTAVRVVCMNTLQLSVGTVGQRAHVQVPHFSRFDPDAVKEQLGLLPEAWQGFGTAAKAMAKVKLTTEEAVKFFVDVYAPQSLLEEDALQEIFAPGWELDAEDREDTGLVSIAKIRPKMLQTLAAYDSGPGSNLVTAKGTLWGAVNAVTRYWDHEYKAREVDNRLLWAWTGGGLREKQRAYELAQEMAGVQD